MLQTSNIEDGSCVVLIPTHKANPNDQERQSFLNTLTVLHAWPVKLLLLKGTSADLYIQLAIKAGKDVEVTWADDGHLGSFENYNRMALSPSFYESMGNFEYMLIVQLDAWVFRDELRYWIQRGYDSVGAPLFLPRGRNNLSIFREMFPSGGNGGLSLRRIAKHKQVLTGGKTRVNWRLLVQWLLFVIFRTGFTYRVLNRTLEVLPLAERKVKHAARLFNEDVWLTIVCAIRNRDFRVAPPKEALGFSLEVNAEEILKFHLRLGTPFGVHGVGKYISPEFLKSITSNYERRNRSYAKLRRRRVPTSDGRYSSQRSN